MKVFKVVAYWILVWCLPLFLVASTLRWGINEMRLYEYGVDNYRISNVTGIAKPELMKIYQHLIDYYNLKVDTAQVIVVRSGNDFTIFNEKELVHLHDVKELVRLDYTVQMVTFIILAICVLVFLLWLRESWQTVLKGFMWGGVVTFGLMIILALWSLFAFEQLFILFHLISFTNDFWVLDPSTDYLIMLFPEGFFYDVALFGFVAVIAESLILGCIAFGALKLLRGQRN